MTKPLFIATLALGAATASAEDFSHVSGMQVLPQGELNYIQAPSDHFSGKARFAHYPKVDASRDGWAIVDFEAGTVNSWHSHSKGQYLIITQGTGLVQEWGKPIQVVKKGDVVWIPADVKHWHGAAPGMTMSHIAIAPDEANNKTTWHEKVDPETLSAFAVKPDESVRQTTPLTRRQLAIVPIAALSAEGRTDELKSALELGLARGLTVNEIREIFVHQHAYAGFPRALNGLITFNTLLKERVAHGIKDIEGEAAAPDEPDNNYARGMQTLVDMGSARATEGTLFDSDGMDHALKANLFGYLFGRGILSYTDREVVVIATIASLGQGVDAQLGAHMKNIHALGVGPADLRKIVDGVKSTSPKNGVNAQQVLDGLGMK